MRRFEINGYSMAYVEEGTGDPLVTVHGSLSDYRYWDRMPERPRQSRATIPTLSSAQIKDKRAPITKADAAAVSMPTLLIGGENTPPPFPHILDVLERVLPNCKRVTISSASHIMNVEQPQQFNAALLDLSLSLLRS